MRTDNIEHKTLFTIPTASFSTAMAVPKALPPQEVVTGHKQTDAYLWILKVIRLNEPAHLDAAEEALGKLKISPKDAQQRYIDYLHRTGAHPLQIAFGTMSMDNPAGYIKAAKKAIETASSVRNIFGSYEAALEKTQAEKMMLVGELAEIYEPFYYWNEQEKLEECMYGQRIIETMALRKATSKGFANVLPTPNSISDVVKEILYWRWLHEMRRTGL
ncbi:helix-turn-helix domain-containing protein [Rouxiella chamberiensis]|uniref:Helix-turn-helix domain-containing protein n=1 Tax=Rouxiella chamberiensis TaxID=1513468 RepID=A0ABY7HRQ7_9GAMM|nr:helix-turn-helix domain-containing protein [Rouxiella chamberiensis]WAT01501.1 helix-turn-helix domain-containing protein [Rouxiella chamberiensis]